MKYQINVFIKLFLEKFKWWYFLLVLLAIGNFIYFNMNININKSLSYLFFQDNIGIFYNWKEFLFLNKLLFIFQVFLSYYTIFIFNNYEAKNSPEFIFLRQNKKSLLIVKMLVSFLMLSFLRIVYYFVNYFLFINFIKFNFGDLGMSLLLHFILIVIYTVYKLRVKYGFY